MTVCSHLHARCITQWFQLTCSKYAHVYITYIAFTVDSQSASIRTCGQVIGNTSSVHNLDHFIQDDESCLQTYVSRNESGMAQLIDVPVGSLTRRVFPQL